MRVKRGIIKNRKHKKILELAKGYRMTYSKSYRRAKEAVLHAHQYSYAHRRHRKSEIRKEWIKVISSQLSKYNIPYNKFINLLKVNNINLNRKIIAEMILNTPQDFFLLVNKLSQNSNYQN